MNSTARDSTAKYQRPRPQLVPPPERRPSLLARWHLLSLDAPTVAAVWTVFIARSAHVALPWTAPAAMFTAVWLLYAADRLLDARDPSASELEARHLFHHRHRRAFLAVALPASAFLGWMLLRADPRALQLYSVLAALLIAWLLLVHVGVAQKGAHRLPKELAVGVFFPAAVFIPTVARAPEMQLRLLPAAAIFACLCSLNCLYIYAWEHPRDDRSAHATTRWAARYLVPLSLLACVAAIVGACVERSLWAPFAACALSIAALLALHIRQKKTGRTELRAAADFVLLTPLLLAPILWGR